MGMMEHISLKSGGPTIRQSFKLGESLEAWALQSNATLIGVVVLFDCMVREVVCLIQSVHIVNPLNESTAFVPFDY